MSCFSTVLSSLFCAVGIKVETFTCRVVESFSDSDTQLPLRISHKRLELGVIFKSSFFFFNTKADSDNQPRQEIKKNQECIWESC